MDAFESGSNSQRRQKRRSDEPLKSQLLFLENELVRQNSDTLLIDFLHGCFKLAALGAGTVSSSSALSRRHRH